MSRAPSTFDIFSVDNELGRRYPVGSVRQLSDFGAWLKSNAEQDGTYELWKNGQQLHSVWVWKEKKGHFGRGSTPSKK
jgi:hypothetical protein